MKKKRIKRYIVWVLAFAMVALLAVMPLLAKQKEEETGPRASILTAAAAKGNLEAVLKSGGTLVSGDAMNVTIPSGVKITEFLVHNGDIVEEGNPVAKVDRVTVMNAIVEVRGTMDYIRKQISDAEDDTLDSRIRAAAGGKVKQIHAQAGDSVAEVMLEKGALAVLSLDGRMAVDLEKKTELGAGDTVLVQLESGKEIAGRVESNIAGKLVVTVEDKGYAVGEQVNVSTQAGEEIGSGELYVHHAWNATGYSGTIQSVQTREGASVNEGNTLFVLTDTQFSGNLNHYSALHRKYEALLQDLFGMYETEVLTAPCDGIVSGVDEESAFLLSAPCGEQGWFVDLLGTEASAEQKWTVMLLSSGTVVCTGEDRDGNCKAPEHKEGCAMYCTGKASCPMVKDKKHQITCLTLCISAEEANQCLALNHKLDCIQKCENAKQTGKCPAVGVHKSGCIESCESSDGSKECPATGTHKQDCLKHCDKTAACPADPNHYPQCLKLCTGAEDCPALNHKEDCYLAGLAYEAWAAWVRQVGSTELIVAADPQTRYQLKNGEKGLELVSPSSVNTSLLVTEQVVAVANPARFKAGDLVLFWTAKSGETIVSSGEWIYSSAGGNQSGGGQGMLPGFSGGFAGFGDLSGLLGGFGGFGGFGGMPGAASGNTQQELFELDGDVLLTVTDHSEMKLNVTIDEQDITSVYMGQPAQVEITALKGKIFEAEVTDIAMEGVGNGGSSKFTVELTMAWQEDMLGGMNATAVIPLHTKMDVLTIPVAALVDQKDKTVVYTAQDRKTGELSAPVEVTTGVSDGERVEILEGLKNGDVVYYSYYDVLELDHTAKAERSGLF